MGPLEVIAHEPVLNSDGPNVLDTDKTSSRWQAGKVQPPLGEATADSDACRSVLPIQADHGFRSTPITDSGACRSPSSERVAALENLL